MNISNHRRPTSGSGTPCAQRCTPAASPPPGHTIAPGVWCRQRFALRPVTLAAIRLAAVSRRQGRLAAQRRDQRVRRWTAPGPPPGYGRPWRPFFIGRVTAVALPTLNGVRPGRLRRRAHTIASGVWSRQRSALRQATLAAIRLAAVSRRQGRLAAQGATSVFAAGPRPGLRPVMAARGGPL